VTPRALIVDAVPRPAYDLGADHPFARYRQLPLFDLLARHDLVDDSEWLRPLSATREEMRLAHTDAYLDVLQALDAWDPDAGQTDRELLLRAREHGLGYGDNPLAPGQHRASAAVAGASLHGVHAILSGAAPRACNTTGGLHHAMPDRASGFCLVNDLVVAIRTARAEGLQRVLYVDFDVHHGDGVEYAFREDPSVVTVSFHESPDSLWPGTGRASDRGWGKGAGSVVNVPLPAGTGDDAWCEAIATTLPRVVREFEPELIVSQHGCDPHRDDPLAHLECTLAAFRYAAECTRDLADEVCGGRWLATGGGGYQPYSVIPRAWATLWCVMSGKPIPERVDEGWRAHWGERSGQTMPEWFARD